MAAARTIRSPRITVWPAVTDAMYLLGQLWRAQQALWTMLESGALRLAALDASDAPRMRALMEQYRDHPMDLADAALVRVAEREGLHRILTVGGGARGGGRPLDPGIGRTSRRIESTAGRRST